LTPGQIAAQDTTGVGAIAGSVRDSNGQPALAVTVCVVDTTRCAISGDDGRFRISEIRAGLVALEVTPPGQPGVVSTTVEVRAGLDAVVEIALPAPLTVAQEVTVRAAAFVAPEEVKNSGYLIQPVEIARSAGALQDVARYVQSLPGVVIGSNDFRNDIIVRGGSPLENLFIVDNIEIPNINAFASFASAGGTVSILDTALISDVTFLTGGYPAPYINRVSSVLQISQREGNRKRVAARATLGFAGAGGIAEGPLAGGRGSWIVSARRSFLDFVTDDIGVGGVPVLYTLNGKVVFDVGPRDRVWAVNISGIDSIRLGLTEDSDLTEAISGFDIRYRGWRSATGVNWQRIFDGGVGLLGVTHSAARVTSTVKDLLQNAIPSPDQPVDEVIDTGPVVFRDESAETETTLKYDLTVFAPMAGKVQAGGSVKAFGLDYDTAAPLGNDSPFSVEPGVNPFFLTRSFTAWQTGAYLQATRGIGRRVNVTLGGRFDHYEAIDAGRFSPRAGVSVDLGDRVTWRASYGRYHQQPFFQFLAAFPASVGLAPIAAEHLVTGVTWQMSDLDRAGVEVYRKTYDDYPVSATFPALSLANIGDTFNVRDVLFPMVSDGRGRAQGIELLVERKPGRRWYGQANLALSRARHAGRDGVFRPGSFDSPVVFNVDGGWQAARNWQISARFSYLSGRPFTPFDAALSADARRGIYDLEAVNARRGPAYARLDLRTERTWTVRGQPLIVFAGVQNVLNRRNVAGYSWNRRLNEATVQEQLGVFPIAGFEWHF